MRKRRAISFILSLLVLLAIALWLYVAKIVSSLAPPLLKSEFLQIDHLQVSSIGLSQTSVAKIDGSAQIDTGTVHFSIRNATISYAIDQLRPEQIRIEQAEIDYIPVARGKPSRETSASALIFPPKLTIDQLGFRVGDSAGEFSGYFELLGSDRKFSLLARDDKLVLRVGGDSTLTEFRVRLEQLEGAEITDARVTLHETEITAIQGLVDLAPLRALLRETRILPRDYQDVVDQIRVASGSVQATARRVTGNDWTAQITADLHNLQTQEYYASGKLEGDLNLAADGWNFVLSQPGSLQINMPGFQLDEISSLTAELPSGYAVSQTSSAQTPATLGGVGTAGISFHRMQTADLTVDLVDWTLQEWRQASLSVRNIKVSSPYSVTAERAHSDLVVTHTSPLLAHGSIDLSGVRTPGLRQEIPSLGLDGEWHWNDGTLDVKGTARWSETPTAEVSLTSNFDSGALHLLLDTPASELLQPLGPYLRAQKQLVAITDGSIKAELTSAWSQDRYDAQLKVSATGIDGRLLGLELTNGSVKMTSSDLVAQSFQFESQVPAVTLANDVDVTDMRFAGRWQRGLYIDRAEAAVLGGSVKVNPVFLDFGQPSQTLELETAQISLEKLFQMIDQEGLTGTGLLNGTVPLRLTEAGIGVDDAHLKNDTKGTISYRAGDDTALQLDNIALQALRDFRYETLDVQLNYQVSGDYKIKARLEGRNPALYDGYPIAFNINLSGSLPGLLRASLVTGDFEGEVLKQIQQQ